jgi:hypothetical protein
LISFQLSGLYYKSNSFCFLQALLDFGLIQGTNPVSNGYFGGDSMVVAWVLKRNGVSNHAYGHLIEDIRTIFPSFILVEISHVRREANKAAYDLARCAIS